GGSNAGCVAQRLELTPDRGKMRLESFEGHSGRLDLDRRLQRSVSFSENGEGRTSSGRARSASGPLDRREATRQTDVDRLARQTVVIWARNDDGGRCGQHRRDACDG